MGSRHSIRNFFRFRFPRTRIVSTTVRTRTRPPSIPTAMLLPVNSLPAGSSPATEPQQVARAGRQHLGSQLTRDSPDRFLVEFQALPCQLGARLLDGQQTDQAAHLGLRHWGCNPH